MIRSKGKVLELHTDCLNSLYMIDLVKLSIVEFKRGAISVEGGCMRKTFEQHLR